MNNKCINILIFVFLISIPTTIFFRDFVTLYYDLKQAQLYMPWKSNLVTLSFFLFVTTYVIHMISTIRLIFKCNNSICYMIFTIVICKFLDVALYSINCEIFVENVRIEYIFANMYPLIYIIPLAKLNIIDGKFTFKKNIEQSQIITTKKHYNSTRKENEMKFKNDDYYIRKALQKFKNINNY